MDDELIPKDAPWWVRLVGNLARKFIVDNWAELKKSAVIWWSVLCASAAEIYAQHPDAINQWIDTGFPGVRQHIVTVAFVLTIVWRFYKQRLDAKENPK